VSEDLVGVDIGGTKVAAGIVDDSGAVIRRESCPTPSTGILDAVVALVRSLTEEPRLLGVAAPGVVDGSSGTVLSATGILPGWAGTPVRAELEARLAVPVAVENDVRAMAHGEARVGAGRAYPDALYVSVGTGIGGAVYRDGRPLRGPHSSAGEIAHLLVPSRVEAGICGCGRRDHLEGAASGPAIERSYWRRTKHRRDVREIARLLRDGDEVAIDVLVSAARVLGRAVAGLLASVDGSAVIIAGGVAQIGPPYLEPLAEAFRTEALPPLREIPVLPAELGTAAPVVGAALLALDMVST
jgi:glucokinase